MDRTEAKRLNQDALKSNGLKVMLLSMPMSSLNHPSIGLSLLQAQAISRGIECHIKYFNLDYANFIGLESYTKINEKVNFLALIGEWLFSHLVDDEILNNPMEYLSHIMEDGLGRGLLTSDIIDILNIKEQSTGFIDYCFQSIEWCEYDVVGFTSTFQQTMPSLALAKRIKKHHPRVDIVFGGANCEGEMGRELLNLNDCIDVIFRGEAEFSFASYLNNKLLGGTERDIFPEGRVVDSGTIDDLNSLPYPVYKDFYTQHKKMIGGNNLYRPTPLFEASRGCWWGEKSHCTFCGLNRNGMNYRSKTPKRAADELTHLAQTYGCEILAVDNILDYKYADTFLLDIRDRKLDLLMHFEVKANLKKNDLVNLSLAGVRKIQPGIETLSTSILELMKKGVSSLINIQTLKLSVEAGIFVDWGFLYGFPGERECEYEKIASLIPKIVHLQPPSGFYRVRADRFSPYYTAPSQYGVKLAPIGSYKYIYPKKYKDISRLAYHFDMLSEGLEQVEVYVKPTRDQLSYWNDIHEKASFYYSIDNGAARVFDNRSSTQIILTLTLLETAVLEYCAVVRTVADINKKLGDTKALGQSLKKLLDKDICIKEGGKILGLPLRQPGFKSAPKINDILESHLHSYLTR